MGVAQLPLYQWELSQCSWGVGPILIKLVRQENERVACKERAERGYRKICTDIEPYTPSDLNLIVLLDEPCI